MSRQAPHDALGDWLERLLTPVWRALHLWDERQGTVYVWVSWFQHAAIAVALGGVLALTPWLLWWHGTAIVAALYWLRELYARIGDRKRVTAPWWPDGIMDALLPTLAAGVIWLIVT